MRYVIFIILSLFLTAGVAQTDSPAAQQPVIDTHVHYNEDMWESLPPKTAIEELRKLGISRAWVSSTPDKGTRMLYAADPEFIVPVLRTYRYHDHRDIWFDDMTVIDDLKKRLKDHRYAAIGEFHLDIEDARSPVIRGMVALAKQHQIILHVHSDAQTVESLFQLNPDALILWAHAGFEKNNVVKRLLDSYPTLWADLSVRRDIIPKGKLNDGWRKLLIDHSDRFTLGVDTWAVQVWMFVEIAMGWQRDVLSHLPNEVATRIASTNADALLRQTSWNQLGTGKK